MAAARITSRRVDAEEGKPLRQYDLGRACRDCGARLSRYNPSLFCYTHQPKGFVPPILRRRV